LAAAQCGPTIRLGMLTSVWWVWPRCCRPASSGLAQLGLYSIAGLVCRGAWWTRFCVASLAATKLYDPGCRAPSGVAGLKASTTCQGRTHHCYRRGGPWQESCCTFTATRCGNRGGYPPLSPVSLADQDLDAQTAWSTFVRRMCAYLVVVTAPDEQSTLEKSRRRVGARLDKLVDDDGDRAGFDSPATLSAEPGRHNVARQASLPAARRNCARDCRRPLSEMPVRVERLEPFLN